MTFLAKRILQEAWERNLSWDEHLPADLASKWETWCREMERAKRLTIPRCYVKEVTSKYTLHGCCDASTKGYAAVIYLYAELYEGVCCRHIPTCRVVRRGMLPSYTYMQSCTKGYAAVIYLHAELYEGVCCRHIPTCRVVRRGMLPSYTYMQSCTKGYAAVIYLHAELYERVCCRHIPTCRVVRRVCCRHIPTCRVVRRGMLPSYTYMQSCTKGYAAVIYLQAELYTSEIKTVFVTSKTRVAPVKASHTIPRLELLSCYILATLMNTVHDAFKKDIDITQTFYWTDSTINLFRIRGLKTEYQQFVQNRLTQIRELSSADDWFYVPTEINPADLPSRRCSITDLLEILPGKMVQNLCPYLILTINNSRINNYHCM